MSTVLEKSYSASNALVATAHSDALYASSKGVDIAPSAGLGAFGEFSNQGANRERYALFRGWVYAAINAIAERGAKQPVMVGQLEGQNSEKKPGRTKAPYWAAKAPQEQVEVLLKDPIHLALQRPNPVQGQWQFVYTFIANLALTGRSYIVADKSNKDGMLEYYALPTTWVEPIHKKGPFAEFKIRNPRQPGSQGELLKRGQVAMAYLPNPGDPLGAVPPAGAQSSAIRIDDHIQSSQDVFFENGVFPSVLVTVGKDPHPDFPAGVRPRLNAAQKRQVYGAIRKTMGGVANYGNPAIIDGLIEKIERLSATSTEMGWEKSEKAVRTRILSAFGVHPFILGEPVGVGGYAQATIIRQQFCDRVNTYLTMLSRLMTDFLVPFIDEEAKKLIWWEDCTSEDRALKQSAMLQGRKNGDVSRNEFRASLGLPPDETGGDRTRQWSSQDVGAAEKIMVGVSGGTMSPEQGASLLEIAFDLEPDEAKKLAGEQSDASKEQAALGEATEELEKATSLLESDPLVEAARILNLSELVGCEHELADVE